jgi:hypothetical protein
LLGKAKTGLRSRRRLEDDEDAFEEDVAEDAEGHAGVALDTAVALALGDGLVIHINARDDNVFACHRIVSYLSK